jgi:nucleotide-binding universal stress UspA family protein
MYKRILVAIDESSTSAKALDEAVRLARALGAALCIAHVTDEGPPTQQDMTLAAPIDIEKVSEDLHETSNLLLDAAVATAAAAGCRAERMLAESARGRIAETIVDVARDWDADLVVIGTHGRRGFARLLVGSVAEDLVRTATTSLMLVREQEPPPVAGAA